LQEFCRGVAQDLTCWDCGLFVPPVTGPIERAATWLSEIPSYIWDGETLPVPVEEIADSHCALHVREVAPAGMLQAPGVPVLEEGATLSGLLLLDPGEIWVNAVEAAQWPGRRRFTVGHELGHWVLHRPTRSVFCRAASVAVEDASDVVAGAPDLEEEASLFASAVLFPPDLVRREFALLGGDIHALCGRFGGSRRATERAVLESIRKPAWAFVDGVQLFHYDDPGYEAWRAACHEDGFVLNDDLAGGDHARLHRACCTYLDRAVSDGVPRTRYPKWCALELAGLLELVPAAGACGRCKP